MQKTSKDILFFVETEVQFDSVKPLLRYLRDNTKITFDIVVPSALPKENGDIYEGAAEAIKNDGFSMMRGAGHVALPEKVVNTKYKVLLSAYMYFWHYENLNVKYRIMFPYASYYFNKPNWTVWRFIEEDYLADALLSHAVGTKEVTDIFTKTYLVPPLKLINFSKKQQNKTKPVLFFAPTYNEINFAQGFLKCIDTIKEKYTVTMRAHPRTAYIKNSDDAAVEELYEQADRVYDVTEHTVLKPLEEADIVVSDNSGVIFDAIYCSVPVVLFSQDPNAFHYRDISTAQSELVKNGDILWTNSPDKILNVVSRTLSSKMLKRQQQMRKSLFPESPSKPIERWMEVISVYLEDRLPIEYAHAKRYWVESIINRTRENQALRAENDKLSAEIKDRDHRIRQEQNPGIKTAARRLIKAGLYKLDVKHRGR